MHLLLAIVTSTTLMLLGGTAFAQVLAADAISTSIDSARSASLVAQGNRLQHGEGVERNLVAALMMYCRAAKLGEAQAFYEMGWMYANARGVDRDDGVAR